MKTLILINGCQAVYEEIPKEICFRNEEVDYKVLKENIELVEGKLIISYKIDLEIIGDYENIIIFGMDGLQEKRRNDIRKVFEQRGDVFCIQQKINTLFGRLFLAKGLGKNILFGNSIIRYQKFLGEECVDTLCSMVDKISQGDFSDSSTVEKLF